jgi:hypothetical protein
VTVASRPRVQSHAAHVTRPGSMASLFLRHALVFAGLAFLAFGLRTYMSVEQQPLLWIGGAAIVGLLSALIAGGWLGLLFLALGALVGVLLEVHLRIGPGAAAARDLQSSGPTLAAALLAMLLAYAGGMVLLGLISRRA